MTSQTSWMDQIPEKSREALQLLLKEKLIQAREGEGKNERQVLTAICQALEEPGLQKLADHLEFREGGNEAKHAQKWLSEWIHKTDDKMLEKLAGLHPKVLVEAAQGALEKLKPGELVEEPTQILEEAGDQDKPRRFNVLGILWKFAVGLLVVSVVAFIAFQAGARSQPPIATPEVIAVVSPTDEPTVVPTVEPTDEATVAPTSEITETETLEITSTPPPAMVTLDGDVPLPLNIALDSYPASGLVQASAPIPEEGSVPYVLTGEMMFLSAGAQLTATWDFPAEFTWTGTLTLKGVLSEENYTLTGSMPLEEGEEPPTLRLDLTSTSVTESGLEFSGNATFSDLFAGTIPVSISLTSDQPFNLGPFIAWQGLFTLRSSLADGKVTLAGDTVSLAAVPLSDILRSELPLQFGEDCGNVMVYTTSNQVNPGRWNCTITNVSGSDFPGLGVIISPSGYQDNALRNYLFWERSIGYALQFLPNIANPTDRFQPTVSLDHNIVPIWGLEVVPLAPLLGGESLTIGVENVCGLVANCSTNSLPVRVWLVFSGTTPPVLIREFNYTASYQEPVPTPTSP